MPLGRFTVLPAVVASQGGTFVPVLTALTLSGSLQIGTATSGTIIGAKTGSTIAGNIPGITINSAARTYSGTPTGSAQTITNGLVETLAGATGSPRSSGVTIAAAVATLAAIPLSLSGANPNTVFPPPLVIGNLPAGYQTGDVLRLYIDNGYDTTGSTSSTHTLTDADAAGGSISFGTAVSSITSGVHAFAIRGERGSAFSSISATVVHGDTVAPTISGATPASIAEQQPMAITVTASESSYFAIGGADAALLEKYGIEPATSIGVRLTANALLDYESKASYSFTVTPTDRASNVGAAANVTLTVVDKDDVPDAVVFARTDNAALNTSYDSETKTVSGLDAGIFATLTVMNGTIVVGTNAPVATANVYNGDTYKLRATSPTATGSKNVTLNNGGLTSIWEIRTVGFANAPVFSSTRSSPGGYNLTNGLKTATGTANGSSSIAETEAGYAPGSGTYWLEASYDTQGEPRFAFIIADANQNVGNADTGPGHLAILYYGTGATTETGDGYVLPQGAVAPFNIASGMTLPAGRKGLLLNLTAGTFTGYQGNKKTQAYAIPSGIMASSLVYAGVQLGNGDVATLQPPTNKPSGAGDF